MKFLILFFALFSMTASALELLNPWKGGSQGVELNQLLIQHLNKNNVSVKVIDIENCRLLPTEWKKHKSPIVITWSDDKVCVPKDTVNVQLISQAAIVFCSMKDVSLDKKPFRVGWQPTVSLNGLYEAFEKKYGQITKIPYNNSGQQVQGVIAGEIDIAVLGQGSALSSPLNCFMSTLPISGRSMDSFDFAEKDQYLSLLAVLYDDNNIKSIIKDFVETQEMNEWRNKRSLTRPKVLDERTKFLSNSFDRR